VGDRNISSSHRAINTDWGNLKRRAVGGILSFPATVKGYLTDRIGKIGELRLTSAWSASRSRMARFELLL